MVAWLLMACVFYTDADKDGDGHRALAFDGDDCDDTNAAINPEMEERCATVGVDDDCDGQVDESDAIDASTGYPDADGDTFGATESVTACDPGLVATTGDCDDGDPTIHEGAVEQWNDEEDEDCDGVFLGGLGYYNATGVPHGIVCWLPASTWVDGGIIDLFRSTQGWCATAGAGGVIGGLYARNGTVAGLPGSGQAAMGAPDAGIVYRYRWTGTTWERS